MFFSSLCSTAHARIVLRGLLLALVPLTTACAAAADEQGAPQFPPSGPIGAAGIPAIPAEPLAAAPTPEEAQNGQFQDGMEDDTAIMGDEDALAPMSPPIDDEYADTDPSALTDFHAALDPYGQWVEDPAYGTIWQPSAAAVGGDFAPYETAGHWSYGDDYVWVSDYSWGWAPFHYGRWVYATNGWGWIPGRQYAGAWTTWRRGYGAAAGYVGWAPLPPTYTWRGGAAYGIGVVPPAPYAFTSTSNLFAPSLAGRMVTGPQVGAIGPSTRPVGAVMSRAPGVVGSAAGARGNGAFAGRTAAHPEVSGPTPQSMNIAQSSVTRPPANNAGLNRAAQFSHPSTAVALGARGASTGHASANASSGGYRGAGASRVGAAGAAG
ncbi:MAG: DUF6600 domain-containing protein, partial [Polyangiaceae bacterium]